jgi:hypothetical protein
MTKEQKRYILVFTGLFLMVLGGIIYFNHKNQKENLSNENIQTKAELKIRIENAGTKKANIFVPYARPTKLNYIYGENVTFIREIPSTQGTVKYTGDKYMNNLRVVCGGPNCSRQVVTRKKSNISNWQASNGSTMRETLYNIQNQNNVHINVKRKTSSVKLKVVRGNVEISKEKIPIPEQNKFISVTTKEPSKPTKSSRPELPNPTYKYGSLSNYKVTYANFLLNIPAYQEGEAVEITREFNSHYADRTIKDIYDSMDKRLDLYRVTMKDGDIYVIPGKTVNEVGRIGKDLYHAKVESIKDVLQNAALDEYNNFLNDYGEFIDSVKDVKLIDPDKFKDYTFKPADYANMVKVDGKGKDDKKKCPKFRL